MHSVGKSGSVKKLAGAVKKSQLSPRSASASTIAALAATSSPGGCGNPLTHFHEQIQLQSNWCWAAVTVSINWYYHPTSAWTQCLLANNVLGQTTCCADGSTKACNGPVSTMATPLSVTHNWVSTSTTKPAFSVIQNEIDNCRPMAVGIYWNPTPNGGHAVSIKGYNSTDIRVGDPALGYSWQNYAAFPSTYDNGGLGAVWGEISYTKA